MRRIFGVIAVALAAAGCLTTNRELEHTNTQYMSAWRNQYASYEQKFRAADAEIRADIDGLVNSIQGKRIQTWPEVVAPVAAITERIRDAYTIAGRGETMRQYIIHMEGDTTPGMSEIWFQNQFSDWQQRAEQIDRQTQDFLSSFDQRAAQSAQWIADSEAIAKEQGFVHGAAIELPSLYQQAIAYYREAQAATAADTGRRQRIAQSFASMGAYYNQLNYQQQLLNTLNRPRRCNFFGNTMTCY